MRRDLNALPNGDLLHSEKNMEESYPLAPSPPAKKLDPAELVRVLQERLSGGNKGDGRRAALVWRRDEEAFKAASVIFNGAVKTDSLVLAQPTNAGDVSKIIIFCREHDLELSVKAGGSGVHGWSLAGQLILDLSLLTNISISLPDTNAPTLQESFERMHLGRSSGSSSSSSDSGLNNKRARPSLAGSHGESSGSTSASVKRTAHEAWSECDHEGMSGSDSSGSRGKKRIEWIGDRAYRSHSGSSNGQEPDADMDMSRSPTSNGLGGGSSGFQNGTPPDFASPFYSPDGDLQDSAPNGVVNRNSLRPIKTLSEQQESSKTPSAAPRMTYVNPSPTATINSYPFVSTNFSTASSNSSYSTKVEQAYLSSSGVLKLNTHPDPPPYTLVTFGAGVHSKQLDAATATSQYGAFHVPTSAYPVGAGQFLSGGFGFIGRKHGLAMDNLVEAELVLADGRIVWVGENGKHGGDWKEDENPDEVWWALRGAGTILGVVTRFRAKAFYLPSVYAGNLIYMFDRNTTPSLFRHLRDCIKGCPRSVYTNFIMSSGPSTAASIVVIQLCFSGGRAEGESYLQAINSWEGGRCMFHDFSERTFERQQLAVEEVLKRGQGRNWFIKSDMLKSATDELIEETCERFQSLPDGCTWLFEYTGGGALADFKDSVFPLSHRESAFTVAALHQWGRNPDGKYDFRCVTTAQDWMNEVIHPHSPGGPLPCFLESASEEAVSSVYGENYPRLARLKAKMDPTNFIRHAMWPRPGGPDDRRQVGEDNSCLEKLDAGEPVPIPKGEPASFNKMAIAAQNQDKPKGKGQGKDPIQGQEDIFSSLTSTNHAALDSTQLGNGTPTQPTPVRTGAPESAKEMPDQQRVYALSVIHRDPDARDLP